MGLQKGKRLVWEKVSDEEIRIRVRPPTEPEHIAKHGYARRIRPSRHTESRRSELRSGEE
jgi:hypothetical protein